MVILLKKPTESIHFEQNFDAELVPEEELVSEQPLSDPPPRPIVVFMIPGIRSDRTWAQNIRIDTETWSDAEIHIYVVGGEDRLTTAHLVTRFGLAKFRREIENQIVALCGRHRDASINAVCHSMGSSLFSEVVENISKNIGSDRKFDKIVFLGSVCHTNKAKTIFENCKIFVNDVGIRDLLPYIAQTINPIKYRHVGRFGFNIGYVRDRYFDNDHDSCVQINHIKNKVIPLIQNQPVVEDIIDQKKIKLTKHVYIQRILWCCIALLVGIGGYNLA